MKSYLFVIKVVCFLRAFGTGVFLPLKQAQNWNTRTSTSNTKYWLNYLSRNSYLEELELVLLAEDFNVIAGAVPGAPAEDDDQVQAARLIAPVQPRRLQYYVYFVLLIYCEPDPDRFRNPSMDPGPHSFVCPVLLS